MVTLVCTVSCAVVLYYRFQPSESQLQTTHPDPVYVDIGPSTTSHKNTQIILVPPCDDKVEYAEVKQTEKRKINTDSKQGAKLLYTLISSLYTGLS